jgi:hypothetical protein
MASFRKEFQNFVHAGGLLGRPDKAAIRFAPAASPGLNLILNPSQPSQIVLNLWSSIIRYMQPLV